MAYAEKTEKENLIAVYLCPRCGKTVSISRVYCDCHAELRAVTRIEGEPDVKGCNFETLNVNCSDCPETCVKCYSYGVHTRNEKGFGGLDCTYFKESPRCFCCRSQVKLAVSFAKGGVTEILKENKGHFREIADYMLEVIEKPILARISQYYG